MAAGSATGSKSARYRADVDGLRAIAVLAVMLFHVHEPLLPGGFLGVDVFFVISGFLITRNILQDLERGRFSIVEFYRRRIKRIFPVLLTVVAVTLVASHLLLLPEDARDVAKSSVFALASLANVYFWKYLDAGYFAADSSQVPLLHLWSLGVEEQFYILWPVILLMVAGSGLWRRLSVGVLAVAILSFVFGEFFYDRDPSFTFYMLPARAGELLVGGLVAMVILRGAEKRLPAPVVHLGATLGAIVLPTTMFLITENERFPGWRVAIPTMATALLILTGHSRDTFWSRLLSLRPLVWVGLLSYSAYLWHWPLLALFRYGYGEPGLAAGTVAFALTFLLAWWSYRFIEQPARRSSAPLRQVLLRQFLLPAGALGVVALVTMYPERVGLSLYTESYLEKVAALELQVRPASAFPWICQRQRLTARDIADPLCVSGPGAPGTEQAILWGDSHAAHYAGMVEAFATEAGFRFRNVAVGSCPPLLTDPQPFVAPRRLADCRASFEAVRPIILDFPVVIISSAYLFYRPGYLDAFLQTVRRLSEMGKLVIVLGEVPWVSDFDRRCREKAISYPFLGCPQSRGPVALRISEVNYTLRRFSEEHPNVRYFDVTPHLCPDGPCEAFARDGEPWYFDRSHLTMAGSVSVGRGILRDHGLPDAFSGFAGWLQGSDADGTRLGSDRTR